MKKWTVEMTFMMAPYQNADDRHVVTAVVEAERSAEAFEAAIEKVKMETVWRSAALARIKIQEMP